VAPSVVKYVGISKYKKGDGGPRRISEFSKKVHGLAKRYYVGKDLQAREELKEVEEEIDKIVAELYGITGDELEEVKKTLRVLRGETIER
jgi:cytoplasmic iron level regulating protein YaaA (DUF328/UPF0246 family)